MLASIRLTSAVVAFGFATGVVIVATIAPAEAQAPDKKKLAKQYVDAALLAQEAGDYDQAVALYKKAYEQIPHPLMYFNIGQAQRLAGRDEEALAAYQKYIELDPKGAKAKEAQGFVVEIQPRVMKARAEAAERARIVDEAERKRKEAEARATEEERKRKEAEERAAQREEVDEPERDHAAGAGRKKLGLIIGGGGVVLVGVGAVFGVLARSSWNEATALCSDDLVCANDADTMRANQLADDTRLRGNLSTVFFAVGGATVAAGIVLYVTAPSGTSSGQALRVTPSHDGGLVTWSGQW
jgi:tetratricopeptide (TPR) repeat protein